LGECDDDVAFTKPSCCLSGKTVMFGTITTVEGCQCALNPLWHQRRGWRELGGVSTLL
jgi:hypothetical protein